MERAREASNRLIDEIGWNHLFDPMAVPLELRRKISDFLVMQEPHSVAGLIGRLIAELQDSEKRLVDLEEKR